jgi:alkanesulfonate monooxygenase
MSVDFVGMISTRHESEIHPPSGAFVDPDYVKKFARAHEDAGFDRVLVAYGSSSPEANLVASAALAATERLGVLIAHRPGFVFPTWAAKSFATLDQLSRGRVAIHIITGGSDSEQQREGDYLTKDDRYARTDEYLDIVRKTWTSTEPFSHEGRFYKFADFVSGVHPVTSIPIYFGGSSEAAYRVGGKHADTYALWGEPLAETAEQIASVRASAAAAGRTDVPGISVSFRPILGATEELAWERAHRILDQIKAGRKNNEQWLRRFRGDTPQNVGSQRLLAAAAKGELHDRALWTPTSAASGAAGNSTALVGTPETVAAALLDYVDIGATTLLIRGYDPVDDAVDYGRHVLPLVRQELAHRSATASTREPVGAAS